MRDHESSNEEVGANLSDSCSVTLLVQYAFELHVASAPGQEARGGRQDPGEVEQLKKSI